MLPLQSVTVYNYSKDSSGVETWQRTVIKNVQFKISNQLSVATGQLVNVSYATITFISESTADGRIYIDPKSYKSLTDKTKNYTLDFKNAKDVIVKGEILVDINSQNTITKFKNDYPDSFIISSVSDNRLGLLQNIKVVAK